jgi:hypothetical protein
MPLTQIIILVLAGVFLVLYLVRRRSRLKKDQ